MPRIQTIDLPGLLTPKAAAAFLGVTENYLNRLIHLEAISAIEISGTRCRLFRQEEVERYLRTHPRVGLRRAQAGE